MINKLMIEVKYGEECSGYCRDVEGQVAYSCDGNRRGLEAPNREAEFHIQWIERNISDGVHDIYVPCACKRSDD